MDAPGIVVSQDFMVAFGGGARRVAPAGDNQTLLAASYDQCRRRGLDVQDGEATGLTKTVPFAGGNLHRTMSRDVLYARAPLGSEAEAARLLVDAVAMKHGPGRVWFLMGPVHHIEGFYGSDDGAVSIAEVGGVEHALLRAIFFHWNNEQAESP